MERQSPLRLSRASASRAESRTHSRKRKRSGGSRCWTRLESMGFSRPGDSKCPRARRVHATSAGEPARLACPLCWESWAGAQEAAAERCGEAVRVGGQGGELPFLAARAEAPLEKGAKSSICGFPHVFPSQNKLHSQGRFQKGEILKNVQPCPLQSRCLQLCCAYRSPGIGILKQIPLQ